MCACARAYTVVILYYTMLSVKQSTSNLGTGANMRKNSEGREKQMLSNHKDLSNSSYRSTFQI